jgi:putative ABC transport system permease protein
MIAVVLRGMAARRLRTLLTGLAIVLGVAMVAGTFVLTDTIMSAYSGIFAGAYVNTDAVVVAKTPFGATGTAKQPVTAALLDRIRALPQVARAHGIIDDHAQLVAADGTALGSSGGGDETLAFGIASSELDAMNPLRLVGGRWPTAAGEIAVDAATATTDHLRVGQDVGVVARTPLRPYRVVGTFRFAGADNLGPVQMIALDLATAQQILDKTGMVDEIDVAARPGVTTPQLVTALRAALPDSTSVRTAAQQATDATAGIGEQIDLIRYVLLAFGGIALFVGAFIIVNTLSITVGQRTRELATLRMLGASGRQVLGSILAEGLVLGAIASLAGLGVGIGFAKALAALFAAGGIHLPAAGMVFSLRTVAVALGAGMLATLAASLAPGLRATRTPPIRAFRDDPTLAAATGSARRGALITLTVGVAFDAGAVTASSLAITVRLGLLGAGALLVCIGVARATRWAVPPIAAAIAAPLQPLAGTPAELARDNAIRNPARTAITAASLTVSVALILLTAALSQGIRDAIGTSIRDQTNASYVITPQRDVMSPQVRTALTNAGLTATGVRAGTVYTDGAEQPISGIDPAGITRAYTFGWADGSSAAGLAALDDDGALISRDYAAAHHLRIGTSITAQTTSGTVLHVVVRGIYTSPKLAPLLGAITITTHLFDTAFTTPGDAQIYLTNTGAAELPTIHTALKAFPTTTLDTLPAYISAREAPVATAVNLFYVLLGLSILISLLGVINTLTLSITERTREIGVLRTIGTTRTQLRRMIRIESEITAITGALIGILLGLALAVFSTHTLTDWAVSFTLPWAIIAIMPVAATLVGALAGLPAAHHAARLNPLTALSYQ